MKKKFQLFAFFFLCIFTYIQATVVYSSPLDGKELGVGNLLTWKTAFEENIQLFIIEKSKNGLDFENVGTVTTSSEAHEEKTYRFFDTQLGSTKNYYRLKAVELDGTSSFSQTILIHKEKPNQFAVVAYSGIMVKKSFDITLDALSEGQLDYTLSSYKGELISEEFKYIVPGLNDLQINLADLPEGTYRIKLKLDEEEEELIIRKIQRELPQKANVASSKKIKQEN